MTANIETIKAQLKPWKAYNGSIRYYVNNWKEIIGLDVDYYKTGNVSSVSYNGEKWSNCFYNKHVSGTKVWFDDVANIHVDYCDEDWIVSDIKTKVTEAYA